MVSFDPSRSDLAPYGFSCKRWAPAIMRRPDRHNEIEVNFLTAGSLTYLFGGEIVRVEPHRPTAFWAAVPHQIIAHEGHAEYFVLTIPLGWFLRLRLPDAFVQALLHGRMVLPGPSVDVALEHTQLLDWERDLGLPEKSDRRAAFLEIEAQLRRISAWCPEVATGASPNLKRLPTVHDGGLAKAERMAHLVAGRYTEQIDVDTFAREVDLHPKHAMRLFHLVFGTSLASYITQYRIFQAQRLLVVSDLSVVDISEAAGFGSLSRFNRAFREQCACSPRDYRKRHALGANGRLR